MLQPFTCGPTCRLARANFGVTNSKATCSVADFKPLLMAMEAKNLEPSILLMQKVR